MTLTPDARILFVTRAVRTFAYGMLAVILALFLAARGFSNAEIGLVFTLTLVGDALLSLGVGAVADRFGRRRVLVGSCVLVVLAGGVFATTENAIVLTLAAIVGTISPSGAEVGPFLSIEQAAISQEVSGRRAHAGLRLLPADRLALERARRALGWMARACSSRATATASSTRFVRCSSSTRRSASSWPRCFSASPRSVEPQRHARTRVGLHRSRRAVTTLAALFAVDSFGSGLAVQTLLAYWLHRRFGADVGLLGSIFFATNVVAGFSSLLGAPIAKRFGLVNTMVWTHVPGNMLLIAFPFMPTLELSVAALLGRFLVAQMDVPARTSYMMAIVDDDERSAASAIANQAKLVGTSLGPLAAGLMGMSAAPFVVAGVLKIAYDLALYRLFRRVRPPEEVPVPERRSPAVSSRSC